MAYHVGSQQRRYGVRGIDLLGITLLAEPSAGHALGLYMSIPVALGLLSFEGPLMMR